MEAEDRLVSDALDAARRAVSSALATVPGLNPDTEDSLIGQQQWQAIHERRAAGQGVSQIARELELDRKTVRSSLRQPSWKPYCRQMSTPTMLDAHRQWLSERAPQVHYSARILYQELRGQRGWSGSYEIVKLEKTNARGHP